jgi:hypothetical protein
MCMSITQELCLPNHNSKALLSYPYPRAFTSSTQYKNLYHSFSELFDIRLRLVSKYFTKLLSQTVLQGLADQVPTVNKRCVIDKFVGKVTRQ